MPSVGPANESLGESPVILIAEDNPDDALFLRRAFGMAGLGVQLIFVSDGEQAMRYLSAAPPFDDPVQCPRPSLVLLDVRMPLLGGFEVLEWLRAHPEVPQPPVLLYSSVFSLADIDKAKTLAAASCLSKPPELEGWQQFARQVLMFKPPPPPPPG
ncbi:MAG TPA: response regulator [Verrucomicrobiae bacterium]|nr:response regulator [Verrucomicrobiae bacterium]